MIGLIKGKSERIRVWSFLTVL